MKLATAKSVKSILQHYLPLAKNEEAQIWAKQRELKRIDHPSIIVPDEERVEDAGLNYEDAPVPATAKLVPASEKIAMAIA